MKKILLLLFLPFLSLLSLTAQITQEQADEIVLERLCNETGDFTIYAKEDVQANFEITTFTGEVLELGYSCWVYYADFNEETNGKYLIVKESNGNLLEVNTKNDEGPEGLEDWRLIAIPVPFQDYYTYFDYQTYPNPIPCWENLNANLIIINNYEELEHYFTCVEEYPFIDFSEHTLLFACGSNMYATISVSKKLLKIGENKYLYDIEVIRGIMTNASFWIVAILTHKLSPDVEVLLNVNIID
jgi:hypothetical protein